MDTELFNLLFSAQGLGVTQTILLIALIGFSLFRRNEIKELRKEMDYLRKEMDYKFDVLRRDMDAKIDALRRNMDAKTDAIHREVNNLRKAVLLVAQKYVDDPERLERIKDLLTE
ncbi:MAG: hypothetical protein MdMp024_0966 [Bacteroidales bacterium]